MATTSDVAQSLVAMCRAGKFEQPYDALFAANARSVEATGETAAGMDAIHAKGKMFTEKNDVNGFTVGDPCVGGDLFAVPFTFDITEKATGKHMNLEEIGLYTVRDGKIVAERFLYQA
jgi:ketosteroid isomerase-like protein